MNLKIINIKNGSDELIDIQRKLFSLGVTWENQAKEIVQKFNVFNGDNDLIFIISNNKLSWTNKKYGINVKYSEYDTVTGTEFLSK